MRLFVDTVIALLLVGTLAGWFWHSRQVESEQKVRDFARAEVRRFQQQISLQAALANVNSKERGYPGTVDPAWFEDNLPANPMLPVGHPWVEVAGPDQHQLAHPRERIAHSRSLARFWYNPANGFVRARVPMDLSDAAAAELYNYINDCSLPELFSDGTAPKPE